MSLPKYPAYNDSGVKWLGEVPDHWSIIQVKRFFTRKKKLNLGMICENRLSLTMNGVLRRSLTDLDGLQASEFETYQIFEENDLVFKLIDLQNIKTSRVGLVHEKGIMSPAYIRLSPFMTIFPKFGYWFFTDLYLRNIFNQLGGGVRQTISAEELLTFPFPALPITEQTLIAQFLDRETAKIDDLIAEQEKLITLLDEKRQAMISHAVTKGLNPDAPMKDSGVEWLGEVPESWDVPKLSHYSKLNSGTTPDRSNSHYWGGDIPWLKTGEIRYELIMDSEEKITQKALSDTSLSISPKGTLLMAMYGQGITRGRVAILGIEATYNQACVAIQVNERILNTYLQYFFIAGYPVLREGGNLTSQMNLNAELIGKFKILLPPHVEQTAIVSFLDKKTTQLDTLKAEAQRGIDLLKERRSALISAAVTGKIDVRHAMTEQVAT